MNPNYVVFKDGIVTNLHGRALKGTLCTKDIFV